ncbi:anaerobic ribonucleoside-triphosphate reductase activating protein [Parabacteroides sp. Marseille-P3160]|uniref:anaerobic ribonucleoside-triphosphate reductase activating protein n=1 Tax=Parabacteroides sp. Marseille-P3160 TaxID=1917887 RepID=UPI0009BC1AE5|nr:anaerobic ribonucleoside-triphosphate reductase activating protein [Parabacteroides sp. Marseille-P3160]
MLRFVNYDIVFQEVPGEVTLAINLSNCPFRCKGCHSPYLRENTGNELDEETLSGLLERYGKAITCVCFMGGDATPESVEHLSSFLKNKTDGRIKTGWYSGREALPPQCSARNFDYIKLGAYDERLGGLDSRTTNQRFYRIEDGRMIDATASFLQK